jgi:hypothetical protein
MKVFLLIVLCSTLISTSYGTELVCQNNSASRYMTLRQVVTGGATAPMYIDNINKHYIKLSQQLVYNLRDLCKTSATSEEIHRKLAQGCIDLAVEIVGTKDSKILEAYDQSCQINYALAAAYMDGVNKTKELCENKGVIFNSARDSKKIIDQLEKDTEKKVNVISK